MRHGTPRIRFRIRSVGFVQFIFARGLALIIRAVGIPHVLNSYSCVRQRIMLLKYLGSPVNVYRSFITIAFAIL